MRGLGSVRAITDANGNLIETYQTDEFGNPTQTQGTSTQPFGYTGQQSDAASGLYYLRARHYDPAIGRPQVGTGLTWLDPEDNEFVAGNEDDRWP